jgi:parallel beta-helix repeat protein
MADLAAGGTSTPWATLQKAANTVVAGDTVIVRSGTYDGLMNETTDGTSGSKITYQSEVKWGAKVRPTADSGNSIISLSGDHLVFDGFEIDGPEKTTATSGIYSGGGFNTVKNNHIHDIHKNVPSPCSSTGAGALHSGNATVGNGIFDSNVVHDVGIPGCNFDHAIYSDSPDNTWNNNIVYQSNSVGMHMYGSTDEIITNNTVFNNASSGILIASPTCCNNNNLVRNNISVFNGGRGIIEESNTGARLGEAYCS